MHDYRTYHHAIESVMQRKVFFIVGALKSGTTWLQRLLDAHPDVCCKGESHVGDELAPKLGALIDAHNGLIKYKNTMFVEGDGGYPTLSYEHVTYLIQASLCLFLYEQMRGASFACVGEKTPNHIQTLPLLAELIPHAKFIHIIRDGRDCAVSGWFHFHRVNRGNPGAVDQAYPRMALYVEQFVKRWVIDVPMGQDFGKSNPERYREVRYEDLQRDPESELEGLLSFLELRSDQDLLEAAIAKCSFAALSGGRAAGDDNPDSHFRKGIVGDWRNHFDEECLSIFNRDAGALMAQLGYLST